MQTSVNSDTAYAWIGKFSVFFLLGILWNLSSKDSLKERLARESLSELTERVLVPLSGGGDAGVIQQSMSEADIFYNTTGCLRYSCSQTPHLNGYALPVTLCLNTTSNTHEGL